MSTKALTLANQDLWQAVQGRDGFGELRKHQNYEWFRKKNLKKFSEGFKGVVHCVHNELWGQADIHKDECLDVIDLDRAERGVDVIRKSGNPRSDVFFHGHPAKPHFTVQGERFNWNVMPVESYTQKIPLTHIETLTRARQNGIRFEELAVAVPVPPIPKVVRKPVRDPLFLGRVGRRYWVIIGQWG